MGKHIKMIMSFLPGIRIIRVYASIALLIFVNQSFAIGITGSSTYNNVINATGVLDGQNVQFRPENAITPFNPAWGTLTDVEIRIFGDITYTGFAGASWVADPMGTPQFVPYILETEYRLDIDGLFGDYFSLASPLIVEKSFHSPGLPEYTIDGTSSFGFTFDYDELINLAFWGPEATSCSGCDAYTMPLQMDGELEGFIDDGFLLDQLNFNYSLSFMSLGQVPQSISSLSAISNIHVQYTYEFTEFDIPPVPIPAAVWLFGTGLIGLVGFSKRRKAV